MSHLSPKSAARPANFLTVLSVTAAVAVVFLHANGVFWQYSEPPGYWFSANIIESAFYFAVPVFFMITGANLIDYRERYSTRDYCVKRIRKTAIPFVVWTAIGTLYRLLLKEIAWSSLTVGFLVRGFFSNSLVNVYWFFFPLFCVYACIPLLAAVEKEKRMAVFSGLAVVCFLVNSLVPFLISVTRISVTWPFSVSVGSGYLLHVLIGYVLTKKTPSKYLCAAIYLLAAAGLALHIVGTYRLSVAEGKGVTMYKGYYNVPCVMYSTGVFLFCKQIAPVLLRRPALNRLFALLGRYTFPLYLMHWYVLHLLGESGLFPVESLAYRLLVPLPVCLVCMVAAFLLRKIPLAREIVP